MVILDSNVISEFMEEKPDERVLRWFDLQSQLSLWTTTVTLFELRYGVLAMPAGKRRRTLEAHLERWLAEILERRVLSFDEAAAERAAELAAGRRRTGRPGELRDTMIAGIVLASHAKLATRNVKHFEDIASSVVNPWE
jgi:predicted nucleic acid-binding protein